MENPHTTGAPPDPVELALVTDELAFRPVRSPDYERVNRVLGELAQSLTSEPEDLLPRLLEEAISLCGGDAAGISLLEGEERSVFRWHAVAGDSTRFSRETMPRQGSPCGTVLDRRAPQLFAAASGAESLLVPFESKGQPAGTVWLISRDPAKRFDREDARVLQSLARYVGAAFDVIEFRDRLTHRETELQRANERLENDRAFAERVMAILSHDLRTPLSAARMGAQLIGRKAKEMMPFAQRIVSAVDRADRLVQELLDTSRLKAGERLPVKLEACRIDKTVQTATETLNAIHGARVEFLNESGDVEGFWDCSAIERVVENLVTNGLKYGDLNGVVTIQLSATDDRAELSVHNKGTPIACEEQADIFTMYRRASASEQSAARGWGIGLAMVKAIAEAHHGSVGLKSDERSGTTFYVYLPRDARQGRGGIDGNSQ